MSQPFHLPERYRLHPPETILALVNLPAKGYILEAGCGKGYFTQALAGKIHPHSRLVALDVKKSVLKEARRLVSAPEVMWVCAEPHRYPFAEACFVQAVCAFSLHESRDPERMLREIFRLLAPRAGLLVVEWQWPEEKTSRSDRIPPGRMEKLLCQAGFVGIKRLIEDSTLYALMATKPTMEEAQ